MPELNFFRKHFSEGFHPGTLNLFVGDSGSWKTSLLADVSLSASLKRLKVLHISLESESYVVADLYNTKIAEYFGLNCLSKDDSILLKFLDLDTSVKESKFEDLLIISKEINSKKLREVLQRVKVQMEYTPAVIVIDFLDIMSSEDTLQSSVKDELSYSIKALKQLAEETKTEIWTATQSFKQYDVDISKILYCSDFFGGTQTSI